MYVDPFDRSCNALVALLVPYLSKAKDVEAVRRDRSDIRDDIEALHEEPYLFCLEVGIRMLGEYLDAMGGLPVMIAARDCALDRFKVTNIPPRLITEVLDRKWAGIGKWRA